MANKREFKKYVTAVSQAVSQDMMDTCYTIDGVDCETVQDAVIDILKAAELAIMKSNVKFDKTPKGCADGSYGKQRQSFYKALFSKANKDFTDAINAAVKKFNTAIPEQAKADNRAKA